MVVHKDNIVCFIGTYTNNNSKGIYRLNFNKQNNSIERCILAYEIDNPTFLAVDDERHILYSPCKINDKSGVASFKYWKEQDKLNFINYNLSETKQPCHLNICKDNQLLVSCNYHENKMIVYNTLEGLIVNTFFISSNKKNEYNSLPHMHYSCFTEDKKYLLSIDLGIDKLIVHEISNNKFILRDDLSYSFLHGTGPRHMACLNSYYYVLSELTSEIFVLKYKDTHDFLFENIQIISSFSKDYNGLKSGAAIKIHPNNNYLYISDRGNNTISLFSISENGLLKYLKSYDCKGECPRDFSIDESGNYLFCANEKSDNISIFTINKLSGELTFVTSEKVNSPTSIVFI